MARSPITGLVEQFKTLTEEQQAVFLDLVDPQVEPELPGKKPRKKRTTKSAKAQSLSSAISKTPKADADADEASDRAQGIISNGERCTAIVESNGLVCGMVEGYQLHHDRGYVDYHPFSLTAQTAAKRSSRKAAAASSTPSTEVETGNAMSASGD